MKAKANKVEMSDAEKMEPSTTEQMLKEVTVFMSDPEKRANFLASVEDFKKAEEKAKKNAKTVMRRLTQEEIDFSLAVPSDPGPLLGWSEERLAEVTDKDVRDRIRDSQAATAAILVKSCENMRLEKDSIREELRTQGYVEREFYVTDDEGADEDEGSGDI